jgi:cyclase
MHLGASSGKFQMAWQLRHAETEAEQLLWSRLSNKQLGVKFRRQHPILDYIADFYCHAHKLVIELDGPIHDTPENQSYDSARTRSLNDFNIKVMRFTNDEVVADIDNVVQKIQSKLKAL